MYCQAKCVLKSPFPFFHQIGKMPFFLLVGFRRILNSKSESNWFLTHCGLSKSNLEIMHRIVVGPGSSRSWDIPASWPTPCRQLISVSPAGTPAYSLLEDWLWVQMPAGSCFLLSGSPSYCLTPLTLTSLLERHTQLRKAFLDSEHHPRLGRLIRGDAPMKFSQVPGAGSAGVCKWCVGQDRRYFQLQGVLPQIQSCMSTYHEPKGQSQKQPIYSIGRTFIKHRVTITDPWALAILIVPCARTQ